MKLYYQKYGLNMRGVAPFFDPDKFESYNYDGEIMKLLQTTGERKYASKGKVKSSKRRLNQTSRTNFMASQEFEDGLVEPLKNGTKNNFGFAGMNPNAT